MILARRLLVAAATVVTLALAAPGYSQPRAASESELKAAYLYNLARFVEWPPASGADHFGICVLGADPFGPALERMLAGLPVRGLEVATRRLATPDQAVGCHVLFIAASEDGRLASILESIGARAMLTVSDMPLFATRGGMIQLVTEANKIRFDVNLVSAQSVGLTLSSDLLRVARAVKRTGRKN
jgi:hypothetical protein